MNKQFTIHPDMQCYQDMTAYVTEILRRGEYATVSVKQGKQKKRTLPQNSAMHKYFELLADELNNAGLDMKQVLKPEIDIPWTPDNVKRHLWKPIQKSMLNKASTTQLEKMDVSVVYDVLNRHLSEKLGIHVAFPSRL
jgi:hypothetical protein